MRDNNRGRGIILYCQNKRHSLAHFISLFLLSLLLAACASTPDSEQQGSATPPSAFGKLTEKPEWYLQQLAKSDGANRFNWELLAARSLLQSGDTQQASAINQQLSKEAITPRKKQEQRLLEAMLQQKLGKTAEALQLASNLDLRPLDNDATAAAYDVRASLLASKGDAIGAFNNLLLLEPYLNDAGKADNHVRIRDLLLTVAPGTLRGAISKPAPDVRTGWLELAVLMQTATGDGLAAQYQQWLQRYPDHPAQSLKLVAEPAKPDQSGSASTVSAGLPARTAVLLPLTGPLAANSEALRNGMLTAYKEAGMQGDLRFYDSNATPIPALYQQLQQDKAELIIGPLLKDQVEALLALNPKVPVLALNEPDGKMARPDIFYYSLAPTADAAETAIHIKQENHRLPLVLVPQGAQGQKIADSFAASWKQLTGSSPVIARYSDRQSLQTVLRQAMGVDASQQRINEIQQSVGQKVFGQPFNRQDVDAIYVYASPLEAGIIRSFIDITQSPFVPAPTYYLNAKGNPGFNNSGVAQSVAGMQVGDMPWMTDTTQPLRDKVMALWPQQNNDLMRFFAMGYDALMIANNLQPLSAQAQTLDGLTGRLSLDAQGTVHRQLNWHKIEASPADAKAAATPANPSDVKAPAADNAPEVKSPQG